MGFQSLIFLNRFFLQTNIYFLIKKKDEKAETPKTIKKINKIFSDFEALIVLIIKYFHRF